MYLVNDKSIAPAAMDGDQAIEYFHIELDTDEVIFAEGTADITGRWPAQGVRYFVRRATSVSSPDGLACDVGAG